MKTYRFLILVMLLSPMLLKAGENPVKFGSVSLEELVMSNYKADESAEAVVLSDMGLSKFVDTGSGFDLLYERTTRIKIFNDAGVKWANIEIPYYREGDIWERILEIEAFSYNIVDGRVIKTPLDTKNSYDEKINQYWNTKKIAVPNVQPGSVIEYRYLVQSQYLFNLRDWTFQWKIPVVYSEYEVHMIPFYEYKFILQGVSSFDEQESYIETGMPHRFGSVEYQNYIHRYAMKEVPAFKDESFISSINDYIIKMDFQLSKVIQPTGSIRNIMTTWDEMIKNMLKHKDFGKFIGRSEKLAPKVMNMSDLEGKPQQERFDMVMDIVKSNLNWNRVYGKYAGKTPDVLIKDKTGSVADINLFATGLLRAAGIPATPVLISTRDNGPVKTNYPFSHFFNYVIIAAHIDGKTVLSDATEVMAANNRIPIRCINDKGLLVNEGDVKWINLGFALPSVTYNNFKFDFSNDKMTVKIEKIANEYDALKLRANDDQTKEQIIHSLSDVGLEVDEASLTIQNIEEIKNPLKINLEAEGLAEIINDKIYITPFLNEVYSENPLKQKDRTYPIDMIYPAKRVFTAEIKIPEGYKTDFIPSNAKSKTSLFELEYTTLTDEDKIIVQFSYYFPHAIYSADEYARLKAYFTAIVRKGSEKVVLSKI